MVVGVVEDPFCRLVVEGLVWQTVGVESGWTSLRRTERWTERWYTVVKGSEVIRRTKNTDESKGKEKSRALV